MKRKFFQMLLQLMIVGLSSFITKGQSIKDFYVPSQSNFNKASFYIPDKNGERSSFITKISYTDKGNNNYSIIERTTMDDKLISTIAKTVKFTINEVRMTTSFKNSLVETNKFETFNPSELLLRMPPIGKTATWTVYYNDGSKPTIFVSSWTTVIVEGVSRKTIKVVSQDTGFKEKSNSYYVQGIGLMDTDVQFENGTTKPLIKFDELFFEPAK